MTRNKWRNTLSRKIILIVLAISLAASSLSAILVYGYFSRTVSRQFRQDNQVKFDKITEKINGVYEQALYFGQLVSADELVQDFFATERFPTAAEEIRAKRKMADHLVQLSFLSPAVSSTALIRGDKVELWTSNAFGDESTKKLNDQWYSTYLAAAQGRTGGISGAYDFYLNRYGYRATLHMLSICVPIYSQETAGQRYGEIIVNVELSTIEEILREAGTGFDCLGFSCDGAEAQVIVGTTDTENWFTLAQQENGLGSHTICFSSDTRLNGVLVGVMGASDLLQNATGQLIGMMGVFFLVLFVVIAAIIPLLLRVTRPVAQLTEAIQQVGKGNLDTHVDIRSNDEFEILSDEMNKMTDKLNHYMQATLQHEIECVNLEYEVLIAQINPHFIYNTLNTVIYLARKERCADVVQIVKALIDLLQDGIKLSDSQHNGFSTIQEEIWIIQNYACIQNYRYQNKFVLETACSEELLSQRVPTSVIQPLVENALFHGIVPMDHPGRILLSMERQTHEGAPYIQIAVKDNGVGIPEKKIKAILDGTLRPADSRNHIGIQNVINRLSLLYGDSYRFQISSEDGVGTCVEVLIPL